MRSRRPAMVAVVGVFAAVLALSACSGSPRVTTAATAPAGAARDAGVAEQRSPSTEVGGTLRVVAGTPDSLDPARSSFPWMWDVMRLYTRTLVTYRSAPGEPGTSLVPDLAATTGTASDGGATWTYTLKPDQHFEDGAVITSRDIKYAVERSFASDVIVGGPNYVVDLLDDPAAPYGGPYTDPDPAKLGLTTVLTPDDLTIVFRLNRPYADFDHVLALPSAAPVPADRDTGADYGEHPVSSGPYAVTSIDPVAGITLDRNPDWDRASDPVRSALPDRIDIRTGLTGAQRDRLVLGGGADVDATGAGVTAQTRARITGDPALAARSDNVPTGLIRLLALPSVVAPMDNEHCRRAVALALDKVALAAAVGPDVDITATLWPHNLPGYRSTSADTSEAGDPAGAKAELVACGVPDGFATTIATPNDPRPLEVAEQVAASLAAVGIRATVTGLDPATYYGTDIGTPEVVLAQQYGIVLAAWTGDFPTATSFYGPLVSAVRPVGNANFAQVSSPELSGWVTLAQQATDSSEAEDAWHQVDAALVAGSAYVPLLEERVTMLIGERLRNAYMQRAYGTYDLAVLAVR